MGNLTKVAEVVTDAGRTYKGFNFFSLQDQTLFEAIARGEFTISGLRNKDLRARLPDRPSGWVSRCLKRLRTHGLIKAIGRTYKYDLTELGRTVVTTGLEVKELVVIPMLAAPT